VEKAKQAAKKVKHGRSDPNSKAGMKKETLLAMTASKFDDFPTWYREVRFLCFVFYHRDAVAAAGMGGGWADEVDVFGRIWTMSRSFLVFCSFLLGEIASSSDGFVPSLDRANRVLVNAVLACPL